MNSISLLDQPILGVAAVGKVYLVGAGPDDPSLLTLKGKVLLAYADVVVYDAIVSLPILNLINPQAERIDISKLDVSKLDISKRRGQHPSTQAKITQLLIDKAQSHAVVVRLRGGDPFVFGHSSDEMEDLVRAGISVEVVPGTTARIAASHVGVPSAQQQFGSSTALIAGHESIGRYCPQVNWQALTHGLETIVIYMGMRNLAHIVGELTTAGLKANTPIVLVRWGTCSDQETLFGTLETIVDRAILLSFEAPAVVVIGQVDNLPRVLNQVHAATCV